jgi:serine phosphatase RsbU (regulator of sigma subunit)
MKRNPLTSALELVLNLGTAKNDDIQKVRLIRQVNGLCAFFMLVAFSTGLLVFLFMPGGEKQAIVQLIAMLLYTTCLVLNAHGRLKLASRMVVIIFEWHLFFMIFLMNMWNSSALFVIVLYPLLAALVEVSIRNHLFISFFQGSLLLFIHIFLPSFEAQVAKFSSLNDQASFVLTIMSVYYIPAMAAVIIGIIFAENIRAREKQKKLINEITIANKQMEYYTDQLKDETKRLKAELDIARKIQTMVLPATAEFEAIPDLEIACIMRTAEEVGGDYYDIFKLGNITIIGIGDVTGHGLPSGIIMLMAQTAIRALAETAPESPAELLVILNRVLFSNINRIREERNMTLAVFFQQDGRFCVSGQHESIVICRKDGKVENIETMDLGYYVGMLPDIADSVKTYDFRLESGDLLFLYSDGVTEAENEKSEQYGIDRMLEKISRYHELSSEEIRSKMIKDLYNFMGQREILDDITMVVIKQK